MVELCRWICCAADGKPGRPERCCNYWGKNVNLVSSRDLNLCMCGVSACISLRPNAVCLHKPMSQLYYCIVLYVCMYGCDRLNHSARLVDSPAVHLNVTHLFVYV